MQNKIVAVLGIVIFLFTSCVNTPKMPELNNTTKQTIESVKEYLECETISYKVSRVEKEGRSRLYLEYLIYDVKKEKPNLDSINTLLMREFSKNDFDLEDYYRISFFYCRNYEDAKLLKGFDYNGKGDLIEVFYK